MSPDGSHDVLTDHADEQEDGPEQAALMQDEQVRVAAIVASLPERYRAALVLRHIQGLSYPEIAAALGQPTELSVERPRGVGPRCGPP